MEGFDGSVVAKVAGNAKRWAEMSHKSKLALLLGMREKIVALAPEATKRADAFRHLEGTVFQEGISSILGQGAFGGYLNGLIELYEHLSSKGVPPLPGPIRRVGDFEVALTNPRGLWSKLTNPIKVELWSEPNTHLTQQKQPKKEPGLCAVLSAGNFEGPIDVLYQLFVENKVVVAKSHPLNHTATEVFYRAFDTLSSDGFFAFVNGGPEVASSLLHHTDVTSWMMTGGCNTFDAIVFGDKENKGKGIIKLQKPCHAELGAASPYIVVPGDWSEKEVVIQAKALAASKMFNSAHICASPQVIVMDRQWPWAELFVQETEKAIQSFANLPSYYPGTASRLSAIQAQYPATAKKLANDFVFVSDVGENDYLLRNEAFAPALGFKFLDAKGDLDAFCNGAVAVANDLCFGSLSCTVIISPQTEEKLGIGGLDQKILSKLQWGAIGVNIWAVIASSNPYAVWGAPKGTSSITDIQSGNGLMGNVLLLENVRKCVISGVFCDSMMSKLQDPAKAAGLYAAMAELSAKQSFGSFLSLAKTALF